MIIKRMNAVVEKVTDLSKTAREITLTLPESLDFLPGAFVNVFVEKDGKNHRRAYSISSDYRNQQEITLSIRRTDTPTSVSPVFWEPGVESLPLTIMGPLGLNTGDKILFPRVFVFAFGIGVSVAKGLIDYLMAREDIEQIYVVTGSRTEEEILYKEFFEEKVQQDSRVSLRFVVSKPGDVTYPYAGHLHDYIDDFNFSNATVYMCGSTQACESLKSAIETRFTSPQFLIEAFD
jgi:NAD(P)H-flavin reductase